MSIKSQLVRLKDNLSAATACREDQQGRLKYKFLVKYRLNDQWKTLYVWAYSMEQAVEGIEDMKSTLEVEGRLLK